MTPDLSRDDWERLLDGLDDPAAGRVAEGVADVFDVEVGAAYDLVEDAIDAGELVEADTGGGFPALRLPEADDTPETPKTAANEGRGDGSAASDPQGQTDETPVPEPSIGAWGEADFSNVEADTYPPALRDRDSWAVRGEEYPPYEREKAPFAPWADEDKTKWGDEDKQVSFATAREWDETDPRSDGFAFIQREGDPYAFVDGDDVRDPETGEIHPAFLALLEHIGVTYADVSSSGAGVHAYYRGELPGSIPEAKWKLDAEAWGSNDDVPAIEIYANTHVNITTGDHVAETGLQVREWDTDALEAILDANGLLRDEAPTANRDGVDMEDYEPTATSSDETTDDIRDVFRALDRLDPKRVGERTIVREWTRDKRSFLPTWGSSDDGGTANYIDDCIWHDTGHDGGYGGPAVMAAIDAGLIDHAGAGPSDVQGKTFFEAIDHLRDLGFSIPELEDGDGADIPDEPGPSDTPEEAAADGGEEGEEDARDPLRLNPDNVLAYAGLGEDASISDLDDRQRAAVVWDLIIQSDEYHVRVRRDNGSLLAYDRGVWSGEGERELRHAGRQALGSMNYGANVLAELKAQARSDPRVEVEPEALGVEEGFVAVENGLLDLRAAADGAGEDAVHDLRPDDLALRRLPVHYNPDATAPEWEDLVEEWAETGRADALQEYVGYTLHAGGMPIHRALLLVGSGANGKGTFLHVVRNLLGDDNTTSIELQTLANEKDALAQFQRSIANIDDDLSARQIGAGLGMFKKLVGGDHVRARQLYEEGFEFQATGKHLYAANEVPNVEVPDDDEAFWRRWLLVEFPNHYPPSERDHELRPRLTTPDTLSGVLNWAIDGWARVLDAGEFTGEETSAHQKRQRWQRWGESIDQFISECVKRDEDADRRTTADAHDRFIAWCRENGKDRASQQGLTNKLKAEDVGYKSSIRINGRVTRGYDALGFTDEVPEVDELDPEDGSDDGDDDDGSQQTSL